MSKQDLGAVGNSMNTGDTGTACASSKNTPFDTIAPDNMFHQRQRMAHDCLLIWLNSYIEQVNQDFQSALAQLRSTIHNIKSFTEQNECIDFLTEVKSGKVYLIVESTLGQQLVPLIHDIHHLDTVYIFDRNKLENEQWTNKWIKIKGVYTTITPICESLQRAVEQYNRNSIAMSFMTMEEASTKNVNQLDPSFMYTKIFKEILFEMKYDKQSIENFISYCRDNDYGAPRNIDRFENEYHAKLSIWWYTYPAFIYSMLNSALRTMQAGSIIKLGFLIYDLHHQIEELHQQQTSSCHGKSFIVYRGQGLLKIHFDKLQKTKGGLLSFNSFLSTSKNREVSLSFAEIALTQTDMVGILFKMTIEPNVSSMPFADIQKVSYYQEEEEILFSMHTVFRIDEIKQIDSNNPLYLVELKLTADDDHQLRTLTDRIREETAESTGWKRLGNLLLRLDKFTEAEELYNVLLEQTCDQGDKATYYTQLGYAKHSEGDYKKAVWYYEKGIELMREDHPDVAIAYNNMALVFDNMGEYSKALTFYEKALEIRQTIFSSDHPDLANSYNNIGKTYDEMGDYSTALSFYEKAYEIYEKTLPANHPILATIYNNIGSLYYNMGDYSRALSFYEKALEIEEKALSSNHPSLATSYNNIGMVYGEMEEYSKALSFYEKALAIRQTVLPPNHPSLATSYNNIGSLYSNIADYWRALAFFEKALEIEEKTLSSNHPNLASSYNNIGTVYDEMEEYSKALAFYEKALEIWRAVLPSNHPSLATSYSNIGTVYDEMEEYSKALSFHEKALEIYQETLPPNHPDFASSYNNIGTVHDHMEEYSKALSFHEKALEIHQKTLPSNHSYFATCYNNIGVVYTNMKNYSKALLYLERTLEMKQLSLPPNHPELLDLKESIEVVKQNITDV